MQRLPKATALDTSTGISTVTATDSKGFYTFPQLHIGGPYTIKIDKSGFRTFVSTGVMLNLSSERAVNAILQIGGSSQIVRVKAASAQVETSDTQLKTVIGGKEIADVPLLGRDAVQLQKTAPGVVESSDRMARSRPMVAKPRKIHTFWMARISTTSCSTNPASPPTPMR